MQVKTVNARTQGEDRRQRRVRESRESLQTGSPVVKNTENVTPVRVKCSVELANVQSDNYTQKCVNNLNISNVNHMKR